MKLSAIAALSCMTSGVATPSPKPAVYHTYRYEDATVKQVARIRFLTPERIAFQLRFLDKKTGCWCQQQGEAIHHDPTGNAEVMPDEADNFYGALTFYTKKAPLYLGLSLQIRQDMTLSPRLQIGGVDTTDANGCRFTTEAILRRVN